MSTTSATSTPDKASESTVRIGLVLPEVLGTYGDRGNAIVLAERLRWRGMPSEIVRISYGDEMPQSCDIYLLGGGEDVAQQVAVTWIESKLGLSAAIERGAAVLAVCAGFQVGGTSFRTADGVEHAGMGLLDVRTEPIGHRAIGDVVVQSAPEWNVGLLTGFENHGGATTLGPQVRPLGSVLHGVGNGVGGFEGGVQGRVVGTYLHGPVLARNPGLADLLLTWATDAPLPPLDPLPEVAAVQAARLRAARLRGTQTPAPVAATPA